MSRATKLLAATTIVGFGTSLWLYFDNRLLRYELEEHVKPTATEVAEAGQADDDTEDGWAPRSASIPPIRSIGNTPAPTLPSLSRESRLDRRIAKTELYAALFGRIEGETEEEYRQRVMPVLQEKLAKPRARVAENRKIAEQKAGVTPEQSAALDKAVDKVYSDVLDYANRAIADGTISPYKRNVSGWMEVVGGFGGIMTDAEAQFGKIIGPDKLKAMYEAGFEWPEYVGFSAPWEKLTPPPPAPR
ncbi:MAG: hypothetical protein AB7P03_25695 [Kofleriaceae bacterium]